MDFRPIQLSFVAVVFLVLAVTQHAHAQLVQVSSVSGASTFSVGNSNTSPFIYGGIAGSATAGGCASPDGVNTCDNCVYNPTAGNELACNNTRIYPSLKLTISFTVVGSPMANATAWLAYTPSGGTTTTIPGQTRSGTVLTQGSSDTISIDWGDLCGALTGDSTCSTGMTAAQNIYIALDSNNPPTFASGTTQSIQVNILSPPNDGSANLSNILEGCFTTFSSSASPDFGMCNFYARAGDQKVYIEDPAPNINCNTSYTGVRVFYQPDDGTNTFQTASYGAQHADLQLDSNCNPVGDWAITGLSNGVGYFFRISMLDAANNNAFLLSATDGSSGGIMDQGGGLTCPNKTTGYSFNDDAACDQYATPGTVVGIIPNGVNCFIATAAFGSPIEPVVKTLRAWRDQFLLPYKLGRKFVRFYYDHSPRIAGRIRNSPVLKHTTQVALVPIWAVAWLMLHYGALGALLIILGFVGVLIFQIRDLRRDSR